MELKSALVPLILILNLRGSEGTEDHGYDTYEWKPAATVTEEERKRRPDGTQVCDGKTHQISFARIDLGGHYTVGNYAPSCSAKIYFSWFNKGNPKERYVQDLNEYKVELLVHNYESLSWVYYHGRLPATPGVVHVGKYENNMWVAVCREILLRHVIMIHSSINGLGFPYKGDSARKRDLYVGKYLWKVGGEQSNACVMHADGKEVSIEHYEILQVNLIGKSGVLWPTYPSISPEYLPGWG